MQSNGFFPILQSFSAGNFKNRPTFSPRGMFLLLKSILLMISMLMAFQLYAFLYMATQHLMTMLNIYLN